MVRGGGRDRGRGRGSRGGHGRGTGHHAAAWDDGETNDFTAGGEMNAHLTERIRGPARAPTASNQSSIGNPNIKPNLDIRKYVQQQDSIVAKTDKQSWLMRPEIPDNDEVALLPKDEVQITPNKIRGKWKDKEKYLRAHFELLREDALSPLREAVDVFKKDPDMVDDSSISIYEKVHIVGFTFSHFGIASRIRFSTNRSQRHILWQGSKRLVSGGLVALSPVDDNFQEKCVVAIVAARPLAGVQQNPPEIDLFFVRTGDMEIDPQKQWIMIEAKTGYYEAHRHTLLALQKMSRETFPLSPHICQMAPDIEPPSYVAENPFMDLSSAVLEDAQSDYGHVDVINQWPRIEDGLLDQTQWQALNQILTKSLAIVLGPPGTGKTFVSTVALEILLQHRQPGDPPIVIAAQTNHALDQLLSHVSKFEPNFIRLGGRSTSLEIKKRALYEVRNATRKQPLPGNSLGKAIATNVSQSKALREILEPLTKNRGKPVDISILVTQGILSEEQGKSLTNGASRWVSADGTKDEPLEFWLSDALLEFEVEYTPESFGFDEEDEDLEVEQLREHEAEHGVNDEEDAEQMRGSWCAVFDQHTTGEHSKQDLEKAGRLLDTTEDIFGVAQAMRGPIYHIIMQRLKAKLLKEFREQAAAYQSNIKELKLGRWERDATYLEEANVIGLTTTGLSKYRALLSALHPKIVLIEEAAEVLEAPVSVACMESVEHLILIGDHEQLQGHCSVRELEGEPYHLAVSMFERLVRNNMPYSTLLRQRRMDPQFRKLLTPIYPDLRDHASVRERQKIDCGMGDVKTFFFDHRWLESRDSQMSTYNEDEARFIAGFYRYLVMNDVSPSSITILTFYNGQRKRLLKEIRAFPEMKQLYNNVKTVDSYQGEENTILLLSLARHNYQNKIGFLENRNRVCVALSRAKQGFYIFGSTETLACDPLWKTVIQQMRSNNCLGPALPLVCKKHGHRRVVSIPEELQDSLGGCTKICREFLSCGHRCQLKCHNFGHDITQCALKCEKVLSCGHRCQGRCFDDCVCGCIAFQHSKLQPPTCSTFSSSDVRGDDETSHDPRSVDTSEFEQWMGGIWISGKTEQNQESFNYLPNQASKQYESHHGMNREAGRVGTTSRPRSPTTRVFNGSDPVRYLGNSVSMNNFYSDEEQLARQSQWSSYASGGVREDDKRLASSSDSSPVKGKPSASASRLGRGRHHGRDVPQEQAQQVGDGRTRFVQQYQPPAFEIASGGGDGATEEAAEEAQPKPTGVKLGTLIEF